MKTLEKTHQFLSGKLDFSSSKDFWAYPFAQVLAEISPFGTFKLFEDAIEAMLQAHHIPLHTTIKSFIRLNISNVAENTYPDQVVQTHREYLSQYPAHVIKSIARDHTSYIRTQPESNLITEITLRKKLEVGGPGVFLVPRVLMAMTNIHEGSNNLVTVALLSRNLLHKTDHYRHGEISRATTDQSHQRIAAVNQIYNDGRPDTMYGYIGPTQADTYSSLLKHFADVEEPHGLMCQLTSKPSPRPASVFEIYFKGANPAKI